MQIFFVLDPMCSWCWGFEPELEKLRTHYQDRVDFDIVMGGLRESMPWDEKSKNYLKEHWEQVAQKTDQPFNRSFFEKEAFVYNTHLPCKAVVTVKAIAKEKVFSYFQAVQKAFYQDARDITDLDTLTAIAKEQGIDEETFLAYYASEKAAKALDEDFQKARMLGANAFPSTIMIDDEGHLVALKGYRTFEDLSRYLHR